jgi:two-component system sensor histidine kinase BaeS
MKNRLLWKLVAANLPVIGIVIFVMWLSINYLAADYFMFLMKKYNISPTDIHQMFLGAVHRYLLWASIVALALAVASGLLLTRKVLRPLSQMTDISERIASGDYAARVEVISNDEVGHLAAAFNRMADSLQRIEQLRKTMVIDVAHELRTPLTNIRGYIEALRDEVVAPSKATFVSLHEEILRLGKLVEDLLQLARAEAAKGILRPQTANLEELMGKTLELFQPQFAAKAIAVEMKIPAAANQVVADPEKLGQVFRNLLDNAYRYTPRGGSVEVSTARLRDKVKMIFANSGEGIAAEDLPFIFERFYRGEKSRSRDHGGAGIGLAIVKELIEAHGGEVGADTASDKTRIWFTLPA